MFQPLPSKIWIVWSDVAWEDGTRSVGPIHETFDPDEAYRIKEKQETWIKNHKLPVKSSIVVVYGLSLPPIVPVHKTYQSGMFVIAKEDQEALSTILSDLHRRFIKWLRR